MTQAQIKQALENLRKVLKLVRIAVIKQYKIVVKKLIYIADTARVMLIGYLPLAGEINEVIEIENVIHLIFFIIECVVKK